MKPAPFEYYRPTTVDEVLVHIAERGDDAKLLAGGQSLIPTMNFRLAQPAVLIDLNGVEGLSHIGRGESDGVRVGAMTTQRDVERSSLIANEAPLVHEALPFIGHPQIRNRGTMGGSIAHADPAAELPVVMLIHDASFHVRNQDGTRWIPAGDFFTGLFTTALGATDLLVEIAIPPLPARSGWAFDEIARRHGDFALVGVAAVVTLDDRGHCEKARIALLSVGDGPVMASQAAQELESEAPTADTIRAAAEAACNRDIDPPGDIHASQAYRRHLARVLTTRVLMRAFERAGASGISS